ncbi:MAG: hypothetical protein AVDCRST_MAG78-2148 [uncultured Rubrobacteraceae bacterium]|uniref:Uncharacterized protein n=1 Tax=uncultured Rubrobacteraceae bacterium TaxID=349277 RepID=A0A6J4QBZ3_9ACTN|nr:MAG: hypothetical protein AVDCRST_MAG78-2148 [uncultured Rubrobacteraceae bacterium]
MTERRKGDSEPGIRRALSRVRTEDTEEEVGARSRVRRARTTACATPEATTQDQRGSI